MLGIGDTPELVLKEQSYAGEDASRALKGKRDAYFEEVEGFTPTPIYEGGKLNNGMEIDGPAIIEDGLTTTVVIPGSKISVNRLGTYVMEVG